jgi:hypothetical protein
VPPRFAYWTILIDDKPTAFRAREREELQPTFTQLQRKNTNVVMRWFARGKLWASREAERDDFQKQRQAALAPRERRGDAPKAAERRGSDWRPGGTHKDPRDRFKKKNRPERAWSDKDRPLSDKPPRPGGWRPKPSDEAKQPWSGKPRDKSDGFRSAGPGKARDRKPWRDRPAPPANDRPWQTKPTGPRAQRRPWSERNDRSDRPWQNKPPAGGTGDARPRDKPVGGPGGSRPWSNRPAGEGKRPWSGKPRSDQRKPFTPRDTPSRPRFDRPPRKKRNDDPDRD